MSGRKSTSKYRRFKRKLLEHTPHECCHYCNKSLNRQLGEVTLDHKIPVSKGGEMYDPKNIVISCYPCNFTKNNLNYEDFIRLKVS